MQPVMVSLILPLMVIIIRHTMELVIVIAAFLSVIVGQRAGVALTRFVLGRLAIRVSVAAILNRPMVKDDRLEAVIAV